MTLNVVGVVLIAIFFVAMFLFGILVSWKTRKFLKTSKAIMIGNKDIGLVVGTITMSATFIGSPLIFGIAEEIFTPGLGLVQCQLPYVFLISSIVSALIFIPKLYDKGFVTVLDPIQNKLGKEITIFFYIIVLAGDVFWTAAILITLSGGITVITGLSNPPVVVTVSACFVAVYTMLGGLYAVAYTDVLQLVFLLFGLVLITPFVLTNDAVYGLVGSSFNLTNTTSDWLGTWYNQQTGYWIDHFLLMVLGFSVTQGLMQRVFAMKTLRDSQIASVVSNVILSGVCILPILIGAAATNTNWTVAGYIDRTFNNNTPSENHQAYMIFPIAVKYLTPTAVGFIGLAAITSAAMSTADSAILASSSMFTQNIYKPIIRKKASDKELMWVTRIAMLVITTVGAILALLSPSIYVLLIMSGDMLYIMCFPQIVAVLFLDPNSYGSIISIFLTTLLRVLAGEPLLNFPGVIQFPGNDYPNAQFPTKTFIMLFGLATLTLFSYVFKYLFKAGLIPKRYDFLKCKLADGGRSYMYAIKKRGVSYGGDILLPSEQKQLNNSKD